MRSIVELNETIHDCREYIRGVVDKAEAEERDFTKSENAAVNSKLAEIERAEPELQQAQKISSELKVLAAEKLGPLIPNRGTPRGMQMDASGRRFAVLAKGQSATTVYPALCENALGHFILGKLFGGSRQTPEPIRAALSESDNTAGGFLVPNPLAGEWIDQVRARSVVMQAGTRTVMMDSESISVPRLESDVTIATKSENSAFTPTAITVGQREIQAHLAGALVEMSRELAEDSRDMAADMVQSSMVRALAAQVDKWGLQGTGSAQPLGILSQSGITEVSGAVGAISWEETSALAAAVRAGNHEPNACILHPTIYSDLYELTTGDAANAAKNWLGKIPTLETVELYQSTNCPLAQMILGDWTYYMMGMRTQPLVEVSTEAGDAFAKHQVHVKITQRFGFVTADDAAFRKNGGITS